jgi:hypothetical protein
MSDHLTASQVDSLPDEQDRVDVPDLTWEERVKYAKLAIFARRDMVTDTGSIDQYRVADEIEPTIIGAIVKVEGDRTKVGITPTRLMQDHFPEVPRVDQVQTHDEEELAFVDAVYGAAKREVFRVLNIAPDGPIQSRLATNGSGLVLCRMKGARGAEEVAYVTRNRKCIDQDNNQPAFSAVDRAIAKAAALTGMSIERVPEHGGWFKRQYSTALKQSLGSGDNHVQLALDVSTDNGDHPVADDGE